MRVSLLLKRESFGKILEETLEQFLGEIHNTTHQVSWQWGLAIHQQQVLLPKGQLWLCNIYLNSIFVPNASHRIFEPIRNEYMNSPIWYRRPFQKLYVYMALADPLNRLFAQASLAISPSLPNASELLIIPGNHKIHLVDYGSAVAYGIRKHGFRIEFLKQELQSRQLASALGIPVPSLLTIADNENWYCEEYATGKPINRLLDLNQTHAALEKAVTALKRLILETASEEPIVTYIESLGNQIETLTHRNGVLNPQEIQTVLEAKTRLLERIESTTEVGGLKLVTALTHGDFQPANILVREDGGIWLIDWEYSSRRQAQYDLLVLVLQARRHDGMIACLTKFIADGESRLSVWYAGWPGLDWKRREQRVLCAYIFILEEMVLRLQENDCPLFKCPDSGLQNLLRQLNEWLSSQNFDTGTKVR